MNRLRRAVEKKKPAPSKEKQKDPKAEPREEDKFKRAMEEFWVRAALELRGALSGRNSEEDSGE